jgi:predicted RNA-binding protein YlqC (UPF0109 family)
MKNSATKKKQGRKPYSELGLEKVKSYPCALKPSDYKKIVSRYGSLTKAVREVIVHKQTSILDNIKDVENQPDTVLD